MVKLLDVCGVNRLVGLVVGWLLEFAIDAGCCAGVVGLRWWYLLECLVYGGGLS